MESRKFDVLTKSVFTATSRRHALRAITAGLAAGVLGKVGLAPAAAQLSADACVDLGARCKKRPGEPKPRCCGRLRCRNGRCDCGNNTRRCGKDCITRRQCCRNNECSGGQRCRQNRCECGANQQFCNGECIPAGENCPTRVTPSNLNEWIPEGEDAFSQDPSLTTFVQGPGTPPIGDGSVRLHPQAFGTFDADDTQAVLRTLQYQGTPIADIENLSYSIFVPSTDGDPPTLQLAVIGANTNTESGFTSIVFQPGDGANPPAVPDTWDDQEPLNGTWWFTRDIFDEDDNCVVCRKFGTRTGTCAATGACTGKVDVTWQTVVDANPNAELNGTTLGEGSFSFRIGRGDTGAGHLTNVRFNDDIFFFEPD